MATTTYLRLFPATTQFELKNGALNVGGRLFVHYEGTDDLAEIRDENGTVLQQPAILDNDGRALGLFVDSKKVYWLDVQDASGATQFTVRKMTPSGGGAGSSLGPGTVITSNDGSIGVTETPYGYDLSVEGVQPAILKAGADELSQDGQFVFDVHQQEGDRLYIDDQGKIRMMGGWYHYDVTVELAWNMSPRNAEYPVSLYTTLSRSIIDFDASFQHTETIQFSGDVHCVEDGAQMVFGVSGMPTGMVASVIDCGMHAITNKDIGGGEYHAGEGIEIDAQNNISVDLDVVQHKLTAGSNIEIVGNTINATAAPQQQADWAVTDTTSPQFILNKPDLARVATSGSYNDLTDKPAIPAAQVNADWNSNSGVSKILNKPDLSVYARSGDLATVATTGSYDDLSDKPAIPAAQVNADWNSNSGVTKILNKPDLGVYARSADLAEVATTGDYDSLSNKPSIPAAQVNADWNSNSGVSQILNKPNLATVATTGNYNDLSGRPTIPAAQVNADWNASSGVAAILNKPTLFSGDYDDLTDKPDLSVYEEKADLAPVAESGSYNDLTDKPSIPSFTPTQQAAIDSGVNSTKVGAYDTHVADTTIHVTAADKTAWNGKEDASNKKQSLDPTSTTDFPSSKAAADFVNSSIATQTAKFLGNLTLTDLGLTYPATNVQIAAALNSHTWPAGVTVTNNDYVYVEIQNPQTTGVDDRVERYKYSDALASWGYEYTLNNSSFTAAEIAAIDSGITAADKSAYDAHVADGTIHVTAADKTAWDGKQDAIGDLATIRSGASAGATAVQPGDLATVATSGNYSDLNGKPTLFSGDYDDLTNKPDLSVYAESADLATVATSGAYSDLSGKPDLSVYAESADLATVATTGDYDDLINKPSIPAAQVNSDWNASSGVAQILNKPTLAAVATSGAYADLSGTPTINNVPPVTSTDNNKVLKASYSGGVGSYSWEQAPASQVQSDWAEADSSAASYIENKPVPKALVAGTNVSISETVNSLTISATGGTNYTAGQNITIQNNVISATDTTYTAGANINIDANNEISATDTTYTAGEGISISNSNVISSGCNETVLFESSTAVSSFTLSERITNFERLKIFATGNGIKFWTDATVISGAQFIYGATVYANNAGDANRLQLFGASYTSSNGLDFICEAGKNIYFANGSSSIDGGGTGSVSLFKVIGVNRIASN